MIYALGEALQFEIEYWYLTILNNPREKNLANQHFFYVVENQKDVRQAIVLNEKSKVKSQNKSSKYIDKINYNISLQKWFHKELRQKATNSARRRLPSNFQQSFLQGAPLYDGVRSYELTDHF